MVQEAEARQLPAVIAEWLERSDALHWVARALQLDLPLLIEHPELVLPCLYRRCVGFGDTAFYERRVEVPAVAAEVAAIVNDWIEQQPMRWLRALRPPHYPLDAGIVEEYRTSLKGDLRFSTDGLLIGVVGEPGSVGWERLTGRRIDVRDLIARSTPTWSHESAEATLSLVSATRRWDLPIDAAETMSGSFDLGDDLVLAKSWFEDDPYEMNHAYALYLVDASTGAIRWRVEADCDAAIRIGDTLHTVVNRRGVIRYALASGEAIGGQPLPYVSSPVLSPDGRFVAARDESVIRVWDLAQTGQSLATCRVRGGEISPDGKRVLAGDCLCSAWSGELIAEIPFSGRGNWLEGGPPTGAWSHANGVVLQVLWGVTVWDSADGKQIAHYDFDTNARDAVAIDPLGRYFAFFEHPERLAVYELRTGAVLFETRAELQRMAFRSLTFGWTRDGATLWWQTVHQFVRGVSANTDWQPFELAEVPPQPPNPATVQDGLLVVGDLAAPMDSTHATSHGAIFVGGDHYRLED